MLQPRAGCASVTMTGPRNFFTARWCVHACALLLLTTLVTCQDTNNDEVSRIRKENVPENRDLTVLLVNDQQRNEYNTKIGRFHNVKPLIGLLTSTARTFIQDGVTTEFATQILGTTLDNGRIYAQLLTKSSLVLYSKPSNDDDVIVKPTRIHSAFDGEWNVKQDLGFIDPDKFALKNTDYLAPSKMEIVYASKPADNNNVKYWNVPTSPDNVDNYNQILDEPTGRRVQQYNEIPRYNQNNDALNYLDAPTIENDKKLDLSIEPSILDNVNTLHRHSKAYESNKNVNVNNLNSKVNIKEDKLNESNIVKVKPNYDLPTFTIKNEFSPIFYYIDNVETRSSQQVVGQTNLPSIKFFGQKSEPRPKKTFTYEGFADFTTVVGDTVIIFTPNTETSHPQSPDEVNIFPSAKPNKMATKVTHLAAEIPVATSTYKAYEAKETTKLPQPSKKTTKLPQPSKETTKLLQPSKEENRSEKALYNDEESLKKVLYEVDKMPDSISVQYNNGFDLNLDVIQPSEAAITTTENTRLTEDLGIIGIKNINSVATDPLVTLQPSATVTKNPEESITDKDVADMMTSEEEDDNNASEVTDEDDEAEGTTEMDSEMRTTTESGHSEESEEFEVTEENSQDNQDNDEVVCTQDLEIQSTMTTAYRTLTYLTTYFIPLEKSETTTSIKSDVVIESTVGYLTNFACKTSLDIKPTAVVSVHVKSSIHTNLEKPETTSETSVAKTPSILEEVTENMKKTTEAEKETTSQENKIPISTEQASEEYKEEEATSTTTSTSTTTERVEVSVSTEKSTTPDVKTTPKDTNEETSEENEIDLIYKTLYTTYTYFTTFFGESTTSVASHKSVVTNIITSTIDLSKLDPMLLGAFDEDEIAPTSVGIGRPTESFAINSIIDLVKNKDVIESVEVNEKYSSQTPTPTLDDDLVTSIKPDAVKTYFTTYTFFTTIYVGTDANVCSRNEVYTNYVGPEELIPTKTNLAANTKVNFDFRNCKQIKNANPPSDPEENSSMESSVSMEEDKDLSKEDNREGVEEDRDVKKGVSPQPSPLEYDMLFSIESNPLDSGLILTDVKSSSSKGERKYLENNNILDDQISSESNIDEIMPSPTLLLQTSYTTFTYFTTMYIGKDSSKVKSRLETITNVVTETIMPKKFEEESNLPITYYTTFTYWTTLYKDKSTTITSREEIVSNVVTPTPTVLAAATDSPIDTTPIDIDSELPPKELEVELKPSLVNNGLESDDGKATFYTTYTYFTTFYAGNSSQIRSSLETVTNIVDSTKVVEDNQLGRKVPSGAADKNLIQDKEEKEKLGITPTVVKEKIVPTKLPDLSSGSPTVILGTYIDNLFAEVKGDNTTPSTEGEKKILFSQVAVISGNSTYVTSDNKSLDTQKSTLPLPTAGTDSPLGSSTPDVIQSSEPESTTETKAEVEEEDDGSSRKKSRLTFTSRKSSFTPVIIPFASRNRPTFSPKARVPGALGSATTITRAEFTPTITATPTLKSVRPSGFGGNRKASAFPGSSAPGRRFTGRSSSVNPSANVPSPSRASGFGRGSITPSSRRSGFSRGSSSIRNNNLDLASRSAVPKIRPTASSRLRGGRQSSSVSLPPQDQNESETSVTQQEENLTESSEEVTEAPVKTTSSPLNRFRRPPLGRQPGTAITPRSTTTAPRKPPTTRGRLTTTTRRSTTRATTNPLLSLRRQRPNSLFPKRNLFKQPDPEPEEEVQKEEPKVEEEEILEEEEFEEDNDYESSDRKEQQVSTPTTPAPRKNPNAVQIRPFAFRRRTKRQVDYGNRKYSNFRRPGNRATTKRPEPVSETESSVPVTQKSRNGNRYSSRLSTNSRTTTTSSSPKSSVRQPFIIRGESRTTTTSSPAYKRSKSRPSSRTTTSASRPKAPRLSKNSHTPSRPSSRSSSGRSRTSGRTTTSRNRLRGSFENHSGERYNHNNILNDGKYTVTYQIPTEVTIPVVNGKITEYKSVISASPSVQTILENQVSTSIGPLGNHQLVLLSEATELGDNGATKLIRFLVHETPTTTVVFTPTTIRGRKTSYSHIIPSTVYNIEPVTQTVAPEINANVPLANLLLSQLLLGNQQPQINPLLALQGQGFPQQPVVQTPVTEYKTRATTYVTTVTDARETVLTITFRATPIETTIKDPTIKVITATEYITETLVSTPTVLAQQQPQFNSLLLQQLLQQQQQQQAISLQTANPLLSLGQPQIDLNLLQGNTVNDSPKPNILADLNTNQDFSDENQEQDENDDVPPPLPPPKRTRNKPKPAKPAPPKMTSVVTLYVSGRYPGEFSTVLSTVVADDTQNVRKREAIYFEDVQIQPSLLPSLSELTGSQAEDNNTELTNNNVVESQLETESLETIVGDLNKHIRYDASPTPVVKLASPSIVRNIKVNLDEVS